MKALVLILGLTMSGLSLAQVIAEFDFDSDKGNASALSGGTWVQGGEQNGGNVSSYEVADCKANGGELCDDASLTFWKNGVDLTVTALIPGAETPQLWFDHNKGGNKYNGIGSTSENDSSPSKDNNDNGNTTNESLDLAFDQEVNLLGLHIFGGHKGIGSDYFEIEIDNAVGIYEINDSYIDFSSLGGISLDSLTLIGRVDADGTDAGVRQWYLGGLKVDAPLPSGSLFYVFGFLGLRVLARRFK